MSERTLKWGIMSTARINRALISPLRMSPRNRLEAVASRDGERAKRYASEWEIPRSFGSYEALLADPDIDAVYISLPNHLHKEWTVKAAQAGKHVLCEKPLALTPEEVDEMIAAAQANGVVVAEAFMYRHHPQTLKVQELIAGGAIGELRLIRGGFTFFLDRPGDVRLKPELGGGSIWDVGCYPISYARFIAGGEAPAEVVGWQEMGPTGVDIAFQGLMRFANGVRAQFDCGFASALRTPMEFVGTKGSIVLTASFKPDASGRFYLLRGDDVEVIPVDDVELYLGEVEDLAEAVLHGKPQRITLADSRANIETIRAFIRSAEEGRAITLR
jgi:D-xylose 1-dehydrogenase (NADP+, D-xylono-1,5-lactone-forming)